MSSTILTVVLIGIALVLRATIPYESLNPDAPTIQCLKARFYVELFGTGQAGGGKKVQMGKTMET